MATDGIELHLPRLDVSQKALVSCHSNKSTRATGAPLPRGPSLSLDLGDLRRTQKRVAYLMEKAAQQYSYRYVVLPKPSYHGKCFLCRDDVGDPYTHYQSKRLPAAAGGTRQDSIVIPSDWGYREGKRREGKLGPANNVNTAISGSRYKDKGTSSSSKDRSNSHKRNTDNGCRFENGERTKGDIGSTESKPGRRVVLPDIKNYKDAQECDVLADDDICMSNNNNNNRIPDNTGSDSVGMNTGRCSKHWTQIVTDLLPPGGWLNDEQTPNRNTDDIPQTTTQPPPSVRESARPPPGSVRGSVRGSARPATPVGTPNKSPYSGTVRADMSPSPVPSPPALGKWCRCPRSDECGECGKRGGHERWCRLSNGECPDCGKHIRGKFRVRFRGSSCQPSESPEQYHSEKLPHKSGSTKTNNKRKGKRKSGSHPSSQIREYSIDPNIHRQAYLLALSDSRLRKWRSNPSFTPNYQRSTCFSYFPLWSNPKRQHRDMALSTPQIGIRGTEWHGKIKNPMKHILGNIKLSEYYPSGRRYPNRGT